jgi:hypothetical protein
VTVVKLDDVDQRPDGAALLDELHAALIRYVILPSPEAADAVTLYIAATHAQPAWEHASRLVIKSPLKRCGKTRLQEVCRETVHNALPTTNISVAALARSISEEDPPTLILDEADTVFGPKDKRAEGAEDIRGILNAGHSRGWPYVRWDAAARRLDNLPTFAMAIIGGIGDMPDTIEDRAVVVSMRRRAPGEQVAQWRSRRAVPALRELRDRLHEWAVGQLDKLAAAEPEEVPAEDRAADVWDPLIAIADAAGGDWPKRAREACKALTGGGVEDDPDSAGERLLRDLRAVFGESDQLPTATIISRLGAIEEAPWATWHRGEPLSPRALAGLLKPYGVRSQKWRDGADYARGYRRADLGDAWTRYAPLAATSATPPQEGETGCSDPVADEVADAATLSATGVDQPELPGVAPVADVAAGRLNRAADAAVGPTCRAPGCTRERRLGCRTCWDHRDEEMSAA